MNRYPISPSQFLHRVRTLDLGIAGIQIFHLAIFTMADWQVFFVWFFVHLIIQASLWVLRFPAKKCVSFVEIPWRPFVAIFWVVFLFKIASRVPYITGMFTMSLYETRTEMPTVVSGHTYFSIFFYPLAILLSFTAMPRRSYIKCMIGVVVVCLIDFMFIGTRNIPVFVLIFSFIASNLKFTATSRHVPMLVILGLCFVGIFTYSTIYRSLSPADTFNWLTVFELTGSTQILAIDPVVASWLSQYAPAVLPVVFLAHYVTHSIAELHNIIKLSATLDVGHMSNIIDQFCVIGACSREASLAVVQYANPRPNVYQTIFATWFFDFGLAGSVLVWIGMLILLVLRQLMQPKRLAISVAYVSVIISLGSIENYFITGLGLISTLTVFLAIFILQFMAVVGSAIKTESPKPIT